MAELPSNVFLADEFASLFDGVSIGSSDLTSLTLGLDRGAERLSEHFNEFHPALTKAYQRVIEANHRLGKRVSFCGQAISDNPRLAPLLVDLGVDILSLAPDAFHSTLEILGAESNGVQSR